jgi:polyhydroxyalkanoate synthesis regulator phasin
MSNVINQIKTILGMEVKLAQMKLDNGTVLEAEAFEAGMPVFIVNEEDRIALPVGEYKLEDGMMLIVVEEGIIAEVKEAEVVEEAPAEAPEVEVEVEQEMSETATPKKVIESIVKESHFSKEEVDALKAEIEALKTELASLKEVKEEEVVELSAQPLTHNPEAKSEVKLNLYSQSRTRNTFDTVLSKIANIK